MMDNDQYLGYKQNMCKPNDKMKDTPLRFALVDLKDYKSSTALLNAD
jgi:hypothetical protein